MLSCRWKLYSIVWLGKSFYRYPILHLYRFMKIFFIRIRNWESNAVEWSGYNTGSPSGCVGERDPLTNVDEWCDVIGDHLNLFSQQYMTKKDIEDNQWFFHRISRSFFTSLVLEVNSLSFKKHELIWSMRWEV